jgi:hypothetical protein
MLLSPRPYLFIALALSTLPLAVAATPAAKPVTQPADVLPQTFDGWQRVSAPQISTDPQAADAQNVAVLKEYGFNQLATAAYSDGDNKLSIRELRFDDATGAYGAFTFYRVPGSAPNGPHVVFWVGATLVDAVFDHLTVMSATALRELAGDVPVPSGARNIPPPLPGYLPTKNREVTYTRYAIGPEGYAKSGGLLPPDLVDFNRGAEALTGTFNEHNGQGQLTLLEYPTFQIAMDRERAINAFLKAGEQPGWPQPLKDSNTQALVVHRSGPIVAVTSGAFDDADAHGLLEHIRYEATVTWNHPEGAVTESNRAARLLVGAITLFGILGGIAVLLGIFFGSGRVLVRRMMGKPASSVHEAEFIKLDLK